jgi:hypothetical protein
VNGASVTINNGNDSKLTVGRNVTFQTGAADTGNKVLLHNASTLTNFVLKVGGNFTSTGYLDAFAVPTTFIQFNGTGVQTLTVPAGAALINGGSINWLVESGKTVALSSALTAMNTFTNLGTLTFGSNQIQGGGVLALDASGTVNGNGTNQLVSGVSTLQAGGTLNLGALPSFAGAESFLLFGATTYGGSFSTLLPATPGGSFTWDTSQLNTAGILAVSGSSAPAATNIAFTKISGTQVVLNWPAGQGWKLQTQTNSLAKGLSTNWVEVVGATPPYTNTISPTKPVEFFRLVYP